MKYKKTNLKKVFFHDAPIKILDTLYASNGHVSYPSEIQRQTLITYAYVTQILAIFSKSDIVKNKKKGRRRIFELTDFGKRIAEHFIIDDNFKKFDKSEEEYVSTKTFN